MRASKRLLLRTLIGLGLLAASTVAHAVAYRCDDGGRITYADRPCTSGRPTGIVDRAPQPSMQERAAADARQRATIARLDAIDEERVRERRQADRAAILATRRDAGRNKEAAVCRKLALRAQRAHEDLERAGPREQVVQRTRLHRADDDYAARCGKR